MLRTSLIIAALSFAVSTSTQTVVAAEGDAPAVGALLQKYCADCHDASAKKKAGLSLVDLKNYKDATPAVWSAVREQIQLGQMPPRDMPQPSDEEKQRLVLWIADALAAAGEHVENKLELPNYGNYVNHEALFNAAPHPAPATLVRVWRLRPDVYERTAPWRGIQPFSMAPGHQLSDFSRLYVADESSTEIVLRNAQQLVASQTRVKLEGGKVVNDVGGKTPATLLPLLHPEKIATPEEIKNAIAGQFWLAILRAPTEEERTRIATLLARVSEKHGKLNGVRAAMTVPLLMPEAIYRLELGAGELDAQGRRRLTPREINLAVQYTLFNVQPNGSLAAKADLTTQAGVAAFVAQVLEGEPKPRVLKFFDEYFDYEKANGVFKEPTSDLPFSANMLVYDTRKLIQHVVNEDRDVLVTLLTTTKSFATDGNGYVRGAPRIYGLPYDWKPRDGELVELPADQRAGVLTQPAWLVAHSGNFDNDPVRRGKWIREHLLGDVIPDLPISVDAVVPDDKTKTLRERFEVIRNDAYCWKCHQAMNPLGMPFEAYDHFGRFRTKELQRPVDTHGAITGADDAKSDGDVADAVQLIRRLAKSERTQQVFVRYAFRFFLGRNETLRDAKTLQEANRAYAESGGSMKALVVSLLSSDSFLYRAPEL
ncbi:MAG: DUF1588 domain-containing protein [Planctomycetia bacterium]|nr:DUF1588 domain-containing protein [Planctomycetia bacterium]